MGERERKDIKTDSGGKEIATDREKYIKRDRSGCERERIFTSKPIRTHASKLFLC